MDVAVQIFIALTTQRHRVKGLTALFFSSGMLHGAMCRIGLCHRPFGSDQSLPFRLGHVYGRYLQKRPLMGFRPSTHIARSKDILCIRLRTHIGCCATPLVVQPLHLSGAGSGKIDWKQMLGKLPPISIGKTAALVPSRPIGNSFLKMGSRERASGRPRCSFRNGRPLLFDLPLYDIAHSVGLTGGDHQIAARTCGGGLRDDLLQRSNRVHDRTAGGVGHELGKRFDRAVAIEAGRQAQHERHLWRQPATAACRICTCP